jgi:hypothetical protein
MSKNKNEITQQFLLIAQMFEDNVEENVCLFIRDYINKSDAKQYFLLVDDIINISLNKLHQQIRVLSDLLPLDSTFKLKYIFKTNKTSILLGMELILDRKFLYIQQPIQKSRWWNCG